MPTKADIAKQVAQRTGMKETEVRRVLDVSLDEIRNALNSGESVSLRGFGNFKVTHREARTGRNPRTGEPLDIPPGQRVSFKMSKPASQDGPDEASN
ncbi:MAG: HU family DNA-binding protein [Chloroflexota bacterium]|nr:HU family DNA-binding protein [Chloroflexota bacterium]